jgi:hypothetical protein
MTLGRRQIALVLIALYVGAVWARLESLGAQEYPYFDGESGTNYRYARTIAAEGSLPAADTSALPPGGFSPAAARPNGAEYLAGFAFRLVHPFSDVAEKQFASVLTILVSSLCVFTFFFLARAIWSCAAAGVFAAFLAAFFGPLAAVTDGREFLHAPYAFLLVTAHLALFMRYVSRPSTARAVIAAFAALALFGVWNAAGLYAVLFIVGVLAFAPLARRDRRRIAAAHAAAIAVALAAFPYLRSGGSGLAAPAAYWFYRLRFLAGKPDDPSALPAVVRLLWNGDRAASGPYALLAFFLPLVWLVPAAVSAIRERRRESKTPVAVPLAAAAIATALFLVDRSAVFAAALAGILFVSGTFRGFSRGWPSRIGPVFVAAAIVATSSPLFSPSADLTRLAGSRAGLYPPRPGGFTWVSVGNADRELVRHLVTRTSTRSDVILAPSDVSSVIAGFAGRHTVVAPGVFTPEMAARTVEITAAFYTDERRLAETCGAAGATYVLYSIDVLLDASPYSPRYLAGFDGNVAETLAYRMHFAPEKLRNFQLVYENDNYRLFRLTAGSEPVFLSDHPPVYQEAILRALGNDLGAFYGRIVDILATYRTAVAAQARGDEEAAISRFRYCLEHAPFFTRAWLGVGDSLLRMGKPEEAYAAYRRVLSYAPDDTHALYYGALSLAYTGKRDDALRLIGLLLSATGDVDIRKEAIELERALKSGQRIELPPRAAPAGPQG